MIEPQLTGAYIPDEHLEQATAMGVPPMFRLYVIHPAYAEFRLQCDRDGCGWFWEQEQARLTELVATALDHMEDAHT